MKFPRAKDDDNVVVTGKLWNRLLGEVERLGNLAAAAPLVLSDGPAGKTLSLSPSASETVVARLTDDGDSDGLYEWEQVDANADGGPYTTTTGGRTSDDYGPANDPLGGTGRRDVVGLRRGYDPADGSPVWTILTAAPSCGPGTNSVSLGSLGEGSESSATNTASLTIPGDSNTASVSFPFLTRVVYNDSGDEKLYGFQRMLTLSCNGGKLKIEVSAETGYEVDAPEDCT